MAVVKVITKITVLIAAKRVLLMSTRHGLPVEGEERGKARHRYYELTLIPIATSSPHQLRLGMGGLAAGTRT